MPVRQPAKKRAPLSAAALSALNKFGAYSEFKFSHKLFEGLPNAELERRYQWRGPQDLDPRLEWEHIRSRGRVAGHASGPAPFLTSGEGLKRRRLAGRSSSRAVAFGFTGVTEVPQANGEPWCVPVEWQGLRATCFALTRRDAQLPRPGARRYRVLRLRRPAFTHRCGTLGGSPARCSWCYRCCTSELLCWRVVRCVVPWRLRLVRWSLTLLALQ